MRILPFRNAGDTAGRLRGLLTGAALLAAAGVGLTIAAAAPGEAQATGQGIWVRWRIDEPRELRYWTRISSEVNPYRAVFELTGSVNATGLHPKAQRPPSISEQDLLKAGQPSPWVQLPVSNAPTWYTNLIFNPSPPTPLEGRAVNLEFATQPSANQVFHRVDEPMEKARGNTFVVVVRMPSKPGPPGLKQLETFSEWTERRLQQAESLRLGPPPRLTRLTVRTWSHFGTRQTGIEASKERVEKDLKILEMVGVNGVKSDMADEDFRELAPRYGIRETGLTFWANHWKVTAEGKAGKYDYQPGEDPEARWRRVFDNYYRLRAEATRKNDPYAYQIGTEINLGDEIPPATTAAEIRSTPQMLAYFQSWMRQQGLSLADLGASRWEQVVPDDDRARLERQEQPLEYRRLFYHTRRFIDHYTALYYRSATEAALRHFPNAKTATVNFQAGPFQFGYIGNNNQLARPLDFFELARQRAFQGVMMEDWVQADDIGSGRISFGAEVIRAGARKHRMPMASYVVGWATPAKFYPFLMHGIKNNGLYLYGPVRNIGPAWSENPVALRETAEVTRDLKKFEDLIAAAEVRPRRAALLVATTSEIMQEPGLYFAPERQNLYIALKHAYVPVDLVTEAEIREDDILRNYSLLYVSDPQVQTETQKKIAAWVQGGGKLWAEVGAAGWDEYSRPSAILDPVLGVRGRRMVMQPNWPKKSPIHFRSDVVKFKFQQLGAIQTSSPLFGGRMSLPVWGARLEASPTTGKVLGEYNDGRPAIVHNRYGSGEALLVGALVGAAYVRAHYPDGKIGPGWQFSLGDDARRAASALVNSAGVEKPVELSVPGMYTSVMDSPQGSVVFLTNSSGQTLNRVTVRVRGIQNVRAVESAQRGRVNFTRNGDALVMDLPLGAADMLALRR